MCDDTPRADDPPSRVPIVHARLRARGQPRPRVRPDRPTPPRPQAACPPPELLRRRLLGCVAVAAHSAGGASGMPAAAIRPIETWGSRLLPRSFPTAAVDTGSADVVSCQHASGQASEEGGRECVTRCRKCRLDGDADTIRASLGRDEMRRGGSFRMSDINLVHAPQHRQPRQAIATLHRSLRAYVG